MFFAASLKLVFFLSVCWSLNPKTRQMLDVWIQWNPNCVVPKNIQTSPKIGIFSFISSILSLKNLATETPHPQNFQWPSFGRVWIFSGTAHFLNLWLVNLTSDNSNQKSFPFLSQTLDFYPGFLKHHDFQSQTNFRYHWRFEKSGSHCMFSN